MLEALLEEVEAKLGNLHLKLSEAEYKSLVDEFLPWLSIEAEPLIASTKAILGPDIFIQSKIGLEYSHVGVDAAGLMSIPISFGTLFIRNPREETGLSLNINLLRCNLSRGSKSGPASILLELDISSLEAKEAFEKIYQDHRALLRSLVDNSGLEFFTSYCSDIVGTYKGKKASRRIEEYWCDLDVDNSFCLEKNFVGNFDSVDLFRAFFALSAIYCACMGKLSKPRKNVSIVSLAERLS